MGQRYRSWGIVLTLLVALLVGLLAHSVSLAGTCVGMGAAAIGWAYVVDWAFRQKSTMTRNPCPDRGHQDDPEDGTVAGTGGIVRGQEALLDALARYHREHRDDAEEWETTGEIVMPQRTGMTVYALRLPTAELAALRADAEARGVTISDLVLGAIRAQRTARTSKEASTAEDTERGDTDERTGLCTSP